VPATSDVVARDGSPLAARDPGLSGGDIQDLQNLFNLRSDDAITALYGRDVSAAELDARSIVDDALNSIFQLFDGNLFGRDVGDFFQSIPTHGGPGLLSGPLGPLELHDLVNKIHNVNAEGSSPPAQVLGARNFVGDALNRVFKLFSGSVIGRDGVDPVDDFVQGISRRDVSDPDGACGSLHGLSSGYINFLPPVGACDLDALIQDVQNFPPDVSNPEARDLSAVLERIRRILGLDVASRDVTPLDARDLSAILERLRRIFKPDVASRNVTPLETRDLSAVLEKIRHIFKPDVASRNVTPLETRDLSAVLERIRHILKPDVASRNVTPLEARDLSAVLERIRHILKLDVASRDVTPEQLITDASLASRPLSSLD